MKKYNSNRLTRLTAVFFVLTAISAILFRSCRTNWVFIGTTVGFDGFAVLLLALMVSNAVLLGILLIQHLYTEDKIHNRKACQIISYLSFVFSGVFFVFATIYSIGLFIGENNEVFSLNLMKTLKEGSYMILIPFVTIMLPKFPCKAKKITISAIILITILSGINAFYPLSPYKITSVPMIIDNGKEYSVVFSTNDYGTAFVEYTYNGKKYKTYDSTGGRLNSESKIHRVSIPYEHLRNNVYTVGSTRVIEEFSYGSRTGKTITSSEYKFTYNDSENQTWLVISDWHTFLDRAKISINNLRSNYDAVIMLGDASPGIDYEEQVITNIIKFGGEVSNGTKPVVYVRGNHETRGSYANNLSTVLGLEQFYYTTNIGPYSFVVLDSGEDKDDSHIEYGGMNDYNSYRADMIEWLKTVEAKNDKVIALCHAWEINSVEEKLSAAGWKELDRLNTSLMISGHEHKCRFVGDKNDKEKEFKKKYSDIITYIDGGKMEDNYVASLLTLNENGFKINAVDMYGEELVNKQFEW